MAKLRNKFFIEELPDLAHKFVKAAGSIPLSKDGQYDLRSFGRSRRYKGQANSLSGYVFEASVKANVKAKIEELGLKDFQVMDAQDGK